MTIEELTAQNAELQVELQKAKDLIATLEHSRDTFKKGFETQMKLHEEAVKKNEKLRDEKKLQDEVMEIMKKREAGKSGASGVLGQ